ncbi:MAG: flagellar filament capping protein FliD [Verrucomicrobiota bacterium]
MSITIGGFFSGLDTASIVSQLTAINRLPINVLEDDKIGLNQEDDAFGFIQSSLENLKSNLGSLDDETDFEGKTISSSTSSIGTATVESSAAVDSFTLNITQVATSSTFVGNKSSSIPAATDTASTVFGSDVAGTFTINGVEITLTGSEQIDDGTSNGLVGKVNQAMDDAGLNDITLSYNATNGQFTLEDTSVTTNIVIATGSSNFLQDAQLFNNGTTTVTSQNAIGRLEKDSALSGQSLAATLVSSGSVIINGTEISYSDTDTLQNVLDRITLSDAGVTATYDNYSDQVTLTAKDRGANSITVANGTTGNLVEALGLNNGTLSIGNTTKFTVNGGAERESQDQTLTEEELGVAGVTFNASTTGSTILEVDVNVSQIRGNINSFIEQYNSTQNLIESYIRIDTDDPDNSGILASDGTLTFLPNDLRSILSTTTNPTSGAEIQTILDLGIDGNSDNNTISLEDSTALDNALRNNLDEVISLFTDLDNGLVTKFEERIDAYATGVNNTIQNRQDAIADEIRRIDEEIEILEARVEAERINLEAQFALLEQTQASSNGFSSLLAGINSN